MMASESPDRVPLKQYRLVLPFLRPHRVALGGILLVSLLATAAGLGQPYLSKYLIDEALLRRDFDHLLRAAGAMVLLTVLGFALNILSSYHYTRISALVLFEMRLDLYRHLQRLPPAFFVRTRMGDIVSRLNNDIAEVQRVFSDALLSLLANLVFLAGSVAIMLSLSPRLFLVSVAMLPLAFWALRRYQNRLAGDVKTLRERSADIGVFLIETLMGMRMVVSHAREEHEAERFRGHNGRFVDALLRMQYTSYLASALPGTALTLSTAAVFLYGGRQVIDGALTVGGLVAFMAYHTRLLSPLQNLMSLYSSLVTGAVSLGRVNELHSAKVEIEEAPNAKAMPPGPASIEFVGVEFAYQPGSPVLSGVSFEAPAAARCVLLGPSGAGKSTIADLILRFYDPQTGAVLVAGEDARRLSLGSLRSRIAVVEQTPILMHASILENIRYGRPEATMDEIAAAAREAAIDAFIEGLPQKWETTVGDRGLALSAGQRQRVALARALLRRPAVLLLDEPTAALDTDTELAIQRALAVADRDCTVFVITHRESFLEYADLVLELRDGRVVSRQPACS